MGDVIVKINPYTLFYSIVAPSGEVYPTQEVVLYTASKERAIQLLGKEIHRRLGEGYHHHITIASKKIDLANGKGLNVQP